MNKKINLSVLLILFSVALSLFMYSSVLAAVTLVYFRAIAGNGEVVLLWETATELDNAGFYVNRSNQENGTYQRINPTIIAPRGDGLTGAVYEYADTDVINGNTYWYRLESLDFGQQSQFYNPVSAVPGGILTATPSQSISITNTSQSGTGATPVGTPAPTTSLVLTATSRTSGSGTVSEQVPTMSIENQEGNNQETPVENSSEGSDSTPTLIPFPTITIQFPTSSIESGVAGEEPGPVSEDAPGRGLGIIRYWPVGVIAVLWILIVTWFMFTRKHL